MSEDARTLAQLHPKLGAWLKNTGRFREFKDIQRRAIPVIMRGENAILQAPTAGGKTEAVLFPTLSLAAGQDAAPQGVRLLMVVPLKALLNNLRRRVEEYSSALELRSFVWHGDVSASKKLRAQEKPPHVFLTTPESLEVLLSIKRFGSTFFAPIHSVVVDEAHYFAGSARGAQLASLIERLAADVGRDIQRVGLSATVGNPARVLRWLTGSSQRPGQQVEGDGERKVPEIHIAMARGGQGLDDAFVSTCGHWKSIAFVRSRTLAEEFASIVQKHNDRNSRSQIDARVHHSSVSKARREEAEADVQKEGQEGRLTLISTSTLELGIDLGDLQRTIQVGPPPSVASHLQRLGRTGRRRGTVPNTTILLERGGDSERDDESAVTDTLLAVATAQLGLKNSVEDLEPSRAQFPIVVQQLICLSLERTGVSSDHAWEVLSRADAFSDIRREEFDELVAHLEREQILRRQGSLLTLGEAGERRFGSRTFRELIAVFESAREYVVKAGREEIGTLDLRYVLSKKPPFLVMLAGRPWEVLERDDTRRVLSVRATKGAIAPYWFSVRREFAISRLVAQQVRRLVLDPNHVEGMTLDPTTSEHLAGVRTIRDFPPIAHPGYEVRAFGDRTVGIWTYAGDRENALLAEYLRLVANFEIADLTFYRVLVRPPRGDVSEAVMMASAAIHAIRDVPASRAWELSLEFAKALPQARDLTKYDDLVPERLLLIELARGIVSFEHLRRTQMGPMDR